MVYPAATEDPARIHHGGFTWNYDPAASGPRERVILADGWELQAYYDGYWVVAYRLAAHASGTERDLAAAQERAVRVYEALKGSLHGTTWEGVT